MTTTTITSRTRPKPTFRVPDRSIYERRESEVRSYARTMPRQFNKAEDVWMYDNQGGRYLDFLSGCSTLNYGHNNEIYGSMVVYLRMKNIVPPASEPRPQQKK